uniref:Uncharacterized protein n=1 Tax=Glossina austeni TaxID=7395 RepID=A0A1A9VXW2_GLOAU
MKEKKKTETNLSGDCISSLLIFIDDVKMCPLKKVVVPHITLLPSIIQIVQYSSEMAKRKRRLLSKRIPTWPWWTVSVINPIQLAAVADKKSGILNFCVDLYPSHSALLIDTLALLAVSKVFQKRHY